MLGWVQCQASVLWLGEGISSVLWGGSCIHPDLQLRGFGDTRVSQLPGKKVPRCCGSLVPSLPTASAVVVQLWSDIWEGFGAVGQLVMLGLGSSIPSNPVLSPETRPALEGGGKGLAGKIQQHQPPRSGD